MSMRPAALGMVALLPAVACVSVAHAQGSANASVAQSTLTPTQMRADIMFVHAQFMSRERSYSAAARAKAEDALVQLERHVDGLAPVAFELALARIVALADNGHTLAIPIERNTRYNRVGVRLTPLAGAVAVVRATNANADLLGARLVAIDGHPITELRDSVRALAGGTLARRDAVTASLFASPQQLHAMGLAARDDRATYSFRTLDGKSVERQLVAERDPNEPRIRAERYLYPELIASEQGSWRALMAPEKIPWTLAEPDAPFRSRLMPELQAIVIQMRRVFDAPGLAIEDFLRETTQRIRSERPQHLILDMRLNGGGNLQTARDFAKSLPGLVPGRIFVLTSPWTFSAAISTIGYLEQAAPERVTIVGEEVGDRLEFWAEGNVVTLPNSRTMISFSTERHDYKNACRSFTDCHPPVVRYSIAVPTLEPDIKAPWTVEAYAAGRDPALEAIAQALQRRM